MHRKINIVLWVVYVALLAVLLPHTAWAFHNFEDQTSVIGWPIAWAAATAFECAIAALTHKLAQHIERTPKTKRGRAKFAYRYLNAYSLGLVVSVGISTLANLAHAVEFGRALKIFGDSSAWFGVYSVGFGAVLPFVSLLFARVLSNVSEAEESETPEVAELRSQLDAVRREASAIRRERDSFRSQLDEAAAKFGEYSAIFAGDKRARILAARAKWPEMQPSAIAQVVGASPAYVSEVLNG